MLRIVVAVLFMFVLCADFVIEIDRKKVNVAEALIRCFMVLAYAYLLKGL